MKTSFAISLTIFIPASIVWGQSHKAYSEVPLLIQNDVITSTQVTIKFNNKLFEFNKEKPSGK